MLDVISKIKFPQKTKTSSLFYSTLLSLLPTLLFLYTHYFFYKTSQKTHTNKANLFNIDNNLHNPIWPNASSAHSHSSVSWLSSWNLNDLSIAKRTVLKPVMKDSIIKNKTSDRRIKLKRSKNHQLSSYQLLKYILAINFNQTMNLLIQYQKTKLTWFINECKSIVLGKKPSRYHHCSWS